MKKLTVKSICVFLIVFVMMVGKVSAYEGVYNPYRYWWWNYYQPQMVEQVSAPQATLANNTTIVTDNNQLTADERKMVELVNQERRAQGLQPYVVDMRLVKLARAKANDMIVHDYFDHQSPTLGSPFDQMRGAGVKYRFAGENLAGSPTVDRAHTSLMNSPGHRANILHQRFTHIGIGVIDGGRYGKMYVQHFIQPMQ